MTNAILHDKSTSNQSPAGRRANQQNGSLVHVVALLSELGREVLAVRRQEATAAIQPAQEGQHERARA